MPGVTAWMGLLEYCTPKAGETVLVSAASGAVGSVVGQLAKLQGCRAVGIAGGAKKCEYAVKELGFDACVDYKAGKLIDDLKAACPNGVDALFENVGGEVLDASFRLLNPFSRVALCGLISDYNRTEPYGVKMIRALLVNRVKLQGFIVFDRQDLYPRAVAHLVKAVAAGKIKYHETIAEGIAQRPEGVHGIAEGGEPRQATRQAGLNGHLKPGMIRNASILRARRPGVRFQLLAKPCSRSKAWPENRDWGKRQDLGQ